MKQKLKNQETKNLINFKQLINEKNLEMVRCKFNLHNRILF